MTDSPTGRFRRAEGLRRSGAAGPHETSEPRGEAERRAVAESEGDTVGAFIETFSYVGEERRVVAPNGQHYIARYMGTLSVAAEDVTDGETDDERKDVDVPPP